VLCICLGEEAASANQTKLKHRRMAKRLAKERLKSSNMENCNQNDQPCAEDVGSPEIVLPW
jgi:hypothetical protein